MLVQRYHKAEKLSSHAPIMRFLPPHLAKMVTCYLSFIRPLECFFLQKIDNLEGANIHSTYLFASGGKKMNSDQIRRAFVAEMLNHRIGINFSGYR